MNKVIDLRNSYYIFFVLLFLDAAISIPTGLGHNPTEIVNDVSCYDIFNTPHIGKIPHPTNCSLFLNCVEETGGAPIPILQICAVPLLWNFDICDCDWEVNAVCFDLDNPEHVENNFKCACPLKGETTGKQIRAANPVCEEKNS